MGSVPGCLTPLYPSLFVAPCLLYKAVHHTSIYHSVSTLPECFHKQASCILCPFLTRRLSKTLFREASWHPIIIWLFIKLHLPLLANIYAEVFPHSRQIRLRLLDFVAPKLNYFFSVYQSRIFRPSCRFM